MSLSSPALDAPIGNFFCRFLDTNGDGSGTVQAIGDFSGASVDFFITPPENIRFDINRILIQIVDMGPVDAGSYGNGITLTNGISFLLLDGSTVLQDFMVGLPVLTNGDWGRFAFDIIDTSFGTGENYVSARWTFTRGGGPIKLNNLSFAARLNDDFSGLVAHTFLVQGVSYE